MKLIIIESPYDGDIERNVRYARQCVLHSLSQGEAPFASHLFYPQVLDDNIKEQREQGIQAGLAWRTYADLSAFYLDYGWSIGMLEALHSAIEKELLFEIRTIPCHYGPRRTLDFSWFPAEVRQLLRERVAR